MTALTRRTFAEMFGASTLSGVELRGRRAAADEALPKNPALLRGGSNYIFYGLEGCDRSQFDVIPNYSTAKDIIDRQLDVMYQRGQRRLRIVLPIYPEPNMDSAESGILDAGYQHSAESFLTRVRQTGFEEIVAFISDGHPRPHTWNIWDEAAYQHRWTWIVGLRRILLNSGLSYRVDLLNEGLPARNQLMLLGYTRRLWSDYVEAFGVSDTVGFSIIPGSDRFPQIPAVYQGHPPPAFDLHIYHDPIPTILQAHRWLSAMGHGNIPWIIGETFYNDSDEARDIVSALETTGQAILFLLQWPLSSRRRCEGVDETFPASFDNYLAVGF